MKIGIVTFQRADNYGALLQCYALYKYIEKQNPNTEVIDYRNLLIEDRYKKYRKLNRHIVNCLIDNWHALCESQCYQKRKDAFEQLRSKIHFSESRNKEEALNSMQEYDLIFSGSDQVLNPRITNGFDDIYYLNAPGSFVKAVYAGSVGNAQDSMILGEEFLKRILKFDALSFREDDINKYINQKNIKSEKVVDPTLLLKKEEWENIIADVDTGVYSEYLLLYYVQPSEELIKMAKKLADEQRCTIVYFDKSLHFHGDTIYKGDAGPLEFVKLIRYAKCIVTSSFHGTAFSIIFRKILYLYLPRVTEERVRSIAQMGGIENRIYASYDDFCQRHIREHDYIEYDENNISKSIESSKLFIENIIMNRISKF